MRDHPRHYMHKVPVQDPVDPEEGDELPVEPDEGPIPAQIPDDPEYDRVVEPLD